MLFGSGIELGAWLLMVFEWRFAWRLIWPPYLAASSGSAKPAIPRGL